MASGNVIPFPGSGGPGAGFGSVFGATPSQSASSAATAPAADPGANNQAGGQVVPVPALEQLHARMGTTLNAARKATKKLVDKAVPGTVEVGLFNQYGLIQMQLAELAARAAQATGGEELAAIGRDLEGVEKQGNEYVAAVDTALASAPAMPGLTADKQRMLLIGGGLLVVAVGTGAYLYFKKPARRRKLAGLFGMGATAAAEPRSKPKGRPRTARKKLKR